MTFRRKSVRLIKQKGPSDCAICCLSMLTGIPHGKVIKLVGDCWHPKMGMANTEKSLERIGFRMKRTKHPTLPAWRVEYLDFKPLRGKPYEISAEYWRDQIWGRRALLSVPSLNNPGGSHMVYWHYDRLFDPSPKKTYKDFDDLMPTKIVLFMER